MAKRKTITVSRVTDIANRVLANSTTTPACREGIAYLLEQILHDTDNYNGFSYLRQNQVIAGELPGIIFDYTSAREHKYPDDSRKKFFCKSK